MDPDTTDEFEQDNEKPDLGNSDPGKMFTLDGEELSEKELKLLIKVSEMKEKNFKLSRCLLIMFYHFLFFCGTPMVAIPCVYIMEGFDFHLIRNMRFFNVNMYMGLQTMTSMGIVASFYFFYTWHMACMDPTQDVECYSLLDYAPFAILISCRVFVVGIKYAIFSDEHMYILRKLYLTDEVIDYYLAINQTNNDAMGVHITNLNDILEYMEIDENIFSLKVYKDQEEFLIQDEKNLMERLMSENKMY